MTPVLKLDKTGKLRLSEADVTKQVCDFMAAEGWRHIRHNVGGAYSSQAVTALLKLLDRLERWTPLLGKAVYRVRRSFVEFGEKGMPDWLFWKPMYTPDFWNTANPTMDDYRRAKVYLIWVEVKAPGKKPAPHQLAWHEAERARGALVKLVDHFEPYRDWYRETFS